METFSVLLARCTENSPVSGEFPAQRPVMQSFDVFFDQHLNKQLINNREAGDLRCHHAQYDVSVMKPLPRLMLAYCQLFLLKQTSVRF